MLPEELLSAKPMVPDCTASLNVAVTGDATPIPVAPDAGVKLVTDGAGPVVNDQVNALAITCPPASVTPLIVAVYFVAFGQQRRRQESVAVSVAAVVTNSGRRRAPNGMGRARSRPR